MVNERIIFNEPFNNKFCVSDEATVVDLWKDKVDVDGKKFNILRVEVEHEDYENGDRPKHTVIPVIAASSQRSYQNALDTYAELRKWRSFFELQEMFANVNYAYSLTTHKAKGSTFKDAFVDVSDMRRRLKTRHGEHPNGHIIEYNRLLYTATTRPSHRLFLGA